MTLSGGGMTSTAQQRLWAYAGVEPALDIPKITMPDTGTGARHRGDAWNAAVALALATLDVIVTAAGLQRRRAVSR